MEELETKARDVINRGIGSKIRKTSVPQKIKNNKNYTFGLSSDVTHHMPGMFSLKPGGTTNMDTLIMHSDNLREDL